MKSSVAIAVILCGTFLVAWPEIYQYQLLRLATLPNGTPFNILLASMTPERQFGFWFTGSLAIACGVAGGFIAFAADRRRQA